MKPLPWGFKPRMQLSQWSSYRPRKWRCYDNHFEGWGETMEKAYRKWLQVRTDYFGKKSQTRSRKWRA